MPRKTKSKINKSNAIRETKKANPEAGPTEIARLVKEQFNVEVNAATVSTVLSTDKKRNGKVGRPGRPKGSKNAAKSGATAVASVASPKASAASNGNQEAYLQNLLKAKQLVSELGGIAEARNVLNALESLMNAV